MIVYISLGSNINAQSNIRSALHVLKKRQQDMIISPMYKTSAVGFDGDDFLNCVAKIETKLSSDALYDWFREIEIQHGRDRNQPKFSSRSLDIDLLTYGNSIIKNDKYSLPRDEITKYAFVLKPLSDIAPNEKHPLLKVSYLALWKKMDATGQQMQKVNFSW